MTGEGVSNVVDGHTLLTTNLTRNLDLIQLVMETMPCKPEH